MDYNVLLDLATDLGYELALSGAETFRVEESVSRVLATYGVEAEVFAIPNFLIVSILTQEGHPITRMRRIGSHGNDLDAVEKFSNLSRALCSRTPSPAQAQQWLDSVRSGLISYSAGMQCLGHFLGASGFGLFFGGNWMDGLCAGVCGVAAGYAGRYLESWKANPFFRTIFSSFLLSQTLILDFAIPSELLTLSHKVPNLLIRQHNCILHTAMRARIICPLKTTG